MSWSWLCWWRPPCLRRRVTVNFVHDTSEAFDGVLWSSSLGGWYVLKDVSALKSGHKPTKMIGDVVIHRDQIAFFQVTP